MKLKVLEKIIKQYGLVDGQMISGSFLKQMAEEQKMNIKELIALLGISEMNIYRILKKDTITMKVNIKEESDREEINNYIQDVNNDEITKLIKTKNKITKKEIENLKNIYHKSDIEMINILKVREKSYRNIINEKTKYLNIDLLSQKEKYDITQNLKSYKEEGNVINIEDINYLKEKINVSDKLIRNIYGISSSVYNRLLVCKIKTCRVIDTKERKKVKLLKIEMKYNEKYGERYYTKKELKLITNKQGMKLESILLYMNHPKHYTFNKLALEKNSKGIWIGENKQITFEFWKEKLNTLEKLSNQAAINICKIYGFRYDKDELKEIAYEHITDTGFLIEKNFEFDEKLQNNLFRKKGKYAIINFLRKQSQLYLYQGSEERVGITEEKSMIFADNSNNPENFFQS